jgi:S1-C subfamily serine protease
MRTLASILILLIASDAGGSDCGNCEGRRTVGEPGPIRFACPVCEGTGEIGEPAAETSAVVAAAAGGPRPVVCRVLSSEGHSTSCGSGVLVAASGTNAIVLTAWHVVRSNRDQVSVRWPGGGSSPAKVVKSDDAWDLAALLVERPQAAPVTIAAQAPRIGDPLTIAGYGQADDYRERTGNVTLYLSPTTSHLKEFVELKAEARKGDSGGPMFNPAGELSGVLWGSDGKVTVGPCSTRLRIFLHGVRWPASCPDGRCAKR